MHIYRIVSYHNSIVTTVIVMLINRELTNTTVSPVMCLQVIITCKKLESSLLILVSLNKYKILIRINF